MATANQTPITDPTPPASGQQPPAGQQASVPATTTGNISMSQAKQIAEEFLAKKKAAESDLEKLTSKPTESLADLVEEFEEKQNDFQSMYKAGGSFKQKLEAIAA